MSESRGTIREYEAVAETRRLGALCPFLCAVMLLGGCGSGQSSGQRDAAKNAASSAPAIPPEYTAGAKNFFGPDAEVLTFGDLALNGGQQILVADPMPGPTSDSTLGITVKRAAILEKQDDEWKEIFRCDEHLSNEKGYLIGAPKGATNGWRMQYSQDPTDGLELKFTPVAGVNQSATYIVRWNQKLERYDCLDKTGEKFLGELPLADEPPERELQR